MKISSQAVYVTSTTSTSLILFNFQSLHIFLYNSFSNWDENFATRMNVLKKIQQFALKGTVYRLVLQNSFRSSQAVLIMVSIRLINIV